MPRHSTLQSSDQIPNCGRVGSPPSGDSHEAIDAVVNSTPAPRFRSRRPWPRRSSSMNGREWDGRPRSDIDLASFWLIAPTKEHIPTTRAVFNSQRSVLSHCSNLVCLLQSARHAASPAFINNILVSGLSGLTPKENLNTILEARQISAAKLRSRGPPVALRGSVNANVFCRSRCSSLNISYCR